MFYLNIHGVLNRISVFINCLKKVIIVFKTYNPILTIAYFNEILPQLQDHFGTSIRIDNRLRLQKQVRRLNNPLQNKDYFLHLYQVTMVPVC